MTRSIDFRLYLITDRVRSSPRALDDVVREACAAGVRAVQLREKDLGAEEITDLATQLSEITRERGAKLFLNAHSLALSTGIEEMIDGIHLPEDIEPSSKIGRSLLVGASTHSVEGAAVRAVAPVDFLTFGPVFATPSKAQYGPPQGLDALAAVARAVDIPVFALGGVTPENAGACIDAGAHGVALIGAIMGADDVAAEVRRFEKALGGGL